MRFGEQFWMRSTGSFSVSFGAETLYLAVLPALNAETSGANLSGMFYVEPRAATLPHRRADCYA